MHARSLAAPQIRHGGKLTGWVLEGRRSAVGLGVAGRAGQRSLCRCERRGGYGAVVQQAQQVQVMAGSLRRCPGRPRSCSRSLHPAAPPTSPLDDRRDTRLSS